MTGWTKSILAVLGLALTVMVVSWPLAAQEEDRRQDESEERFERDRDERRERRQGERDEEERRDWEEREHRDRHEGHRRERGRRDWHEGRRSHDESRPRHGRDEQLLGPRGHLEVAGHAAQLLVTAGMEDVARIVEERIERLERRIEHERERGRRERDDRDRGRDGDRRRNEGRDGELREFLEHIDRRLDELSRRVDGLAEWARDRDRDDERDRHRDDERDRDRDDDDERDRSGGDVENGATGVDAGTSTSLFLRLLRSLLT